jgi:hypothetical protein
MKAWAWDQHLGLLLPDCLPILLAMFYGTESSLHEAICFFIAGDPVGTRAGVLLILLMCQIRAVKLSS